MAAAASSNVRGMREKVNFGSLPVNIPHAFTLDTADQGVETPGTYGTQYRYMWAGNRISFVDPVIHQLIQQQGATSGDTIKFWRMESRNGNRRGPIQYRVELVNTVDEDEPDSAKPQPPRRQRTPAEHAAAEAESHRQFPEALPARPAAPVQAPPAAAPAASPRQEPATAASTNILTGGAAMLSAALVSAIDAAGTAESYAEAHGRRVAFSSEDIRAMALTVYIGARR